MKTLHTFPKFAVVCLLVLFTGMLVTTAVQSYVPILLQQQVQQLCQPSQDETLLLPGVASLEVPAGALNQTTLIKMKLIQYWFDTTDPELRLEFTPHGEVFNIPLNLTVPLPLMSSGYWDEIGVYYFNETTQKWDLEETITINPGESSFVANLDHFSIYAFVKIRSGN